MRNNILGGLVIFLVVVTCLIVLDDISSPKTKVDITAQTSQGDVHSTDLAVVEAED